MADDFFNDPFDDMVRQFFGEGRGIRRRQVRRNAYEGEEQELGFIETDETLYITVELPGYTEKDVLIKVKGKELEIVAQKTAEEGIKDYLQRKLAEGVTIVRTLPSHIQTKKWTYTFKNGILEVAFPKHG
jgi:HSP20 family molecular chaperone IbpA